ncbi:TolC family protein [Betaproteobacteria bacterium SCN2]|jgi:cobalt-zinc-cadmium efflux system outer membrane protein|nr:TolC family protein [Betaproteobacteria bacterium SCN2]
MVQKHHHRWLSRTLCLAIGGMLAAGNLWAQSAPLTLKQAFEAAWSRQPEAQSLAERREAAEARRQSADSWTAEPPSLEVSAKTDQLNKNQGSREYVAGIALPLWLPGERSRTGALADAESRATASRALGSQLRTAATVREAWWAWQRARIEKGLAQERLNGARQLASDVVRRVKAGDLARSDQHQADGAAATAEVALAETNTALATATQQLRALIGMAPISQGDEVSAAGEPAPAVPADFAALDTSHPAVIELLNRAEVARRGAELAEVQTRANPELTLATTRDRGVFGDPYQQTVTVGIRFPFGSESRNRAKAGLARAEAIEAEGQLRLERERLIADLEAARVRVESAQQQLTAADKRAQLARESRGFFEKSFRLGESDLPTRLRIELEAAEGERQAARARIDLAAAVSLLRQTLGLLPE